MTSDSRALSEFPLRADSTFSELFAVSRSGPFKHYGLPEFRKWYGDCKVTSLPGVGTRLDMARRKVDAKDLSAPMDDGTTLGEFMEAWNCILHYLFIGQMEVGAGVREYVKPKKQSGAFILFGECAPARKYPADGVPVFNFAMQLEMIAAAVPKLAEAKKHFGKAIATYATDDESVFELDLLRACAQEFGTFRVFGADIAQSVVAIALNDEPHWMTMQRMLSAKPGSFLHALQACPNIDFYRDVAEPTKTPPTEEPTSAVESASASAPKKPAAAVEDKSALEPKQASSPPQSVWPEWIMPVGGKSHYTICGCRIRGHERHCDWRFSHDVEFGYHFRSPNGEERGFELHSSVPSPQFVYKGSFVPPELKHSK